MTGEQFLDALKAAIAPATVANMKNIADHKGGISFGLSDGRTFTVHRSKVKAAQTDEELRSYVQSLIG